MHAADAPGPMPFFQPLAAIVLASASMVASAVTLHVAPDGNDAAGGQSWNAALASIQVAVDRAGPGDTIVVRGGGRPYPGFTVRRSGTASAPLTIRGESPDRPLRLSGAVLETGWVPVDGESGVWQVRTTARPNVVVADDQALGIATKRQLQPGEWAWEADRLRYRPGGGTPAVQRVWRAARGGGIVVDGQSHVVIEDVECRVGGGACVSLRGGGNHVVRRLVARWYWRGVDLAGGTAGNVVEDCLVEGNQEGIYLRGGATGNTVRRCRAIGNGNAPAWRRADRAGIAIGETGINRDNVIEDCEVAGNGGRDSDAGLIAYRAPGTILRRNHVHDNFGSGIFVTIGSDGSLVEDNRVERNGRPAVKAGLTNITGLSVRRSRGVTVRGNRVVDNHVSANSPWVGKDLGPRGGLEVRGLPSDDMTGISLIDNEVAGTVGGPDVYVVPGIRAPDLRIVPRPVAVP